MSWAIGFSKNQNRKDGKTFDKKAPDFATDKTSLWRDAEQQQQAVIVKPALAPRLISMKITLTK